MSGGQRELFGQPGLSDLVHHCHARGCNVAVHPELLMCLRHWRMVPKSIQRAVWRTYREGQCDDKRPSKAWDEAASAAIGFVARREGQPITKSEQQALERLL